jgi:hypothetical protein
MRDKTQAVVVLPRHSAVYEMTNKRDFSRNMEARKTLSRMRITALLTTSYAAHMKGGSLRTRKHTIAASVVVWPRRLPTLAIRSQHWEGAGKFLLKAGKRARFVAKRPGYGRCAPFASQTTSSDNR